MQAPSLLVSAEGWLRMHDTAGKPRLRSGAAELLLRAGVAGYRRIVLAHSPVQERRILDDLAIGGLIDELIPIGDLDTIAESSATRRALWFAYPPDRHLDRPDTYVLIGDAGEFAPLLAGGPASPRELCVRWGLRQPPPEITARTRGDATVVSGVVIDAALLDDTCVATDGVSVAVMANSAGAALAAAGSGDLPAAAEGLGRVMLGIAGQGKLIGDDELIVTIDGVPIGVPTPSPVSVPAVACIALSPVTCRSGIEPLCLLVARALQRAFEDFTADSPRAALEAVAGALAELESAAPTPLPTVITWRRP